MTRVRAAVVGATGYIGMQCTALLARHPDVDLVALVGRSAAGRPFSAVVPGSDVDLVVTDQVVSGDVDVVMAALPHTAAAGQAAIWLDAGALVVDLSADFRLRDIDEYERWYHATHPARELAGRAVYGLPELHRDELRAAALIAAPGCYPTAALLAVAPALRARLVEPDVVVDAKSGVSGAGRSPSLGVHFSEVNESVHAYGVEGHRHKAEMLQELRLLSRDPVRLTFVPHLIPMTRGLLATAYLRPRPGVDVEVVRALYRELCDGNAFLRYEDAPPRTKSVLGTNFCALNVSVQDGMVVVTSAIDNLVRGAAGQAVQAMNLRLGLDEGAGLNLQAAWP